jgi:3-methyl-2-oxobutanoate hydroxymethyltransferase
MSAHTHNAQSAPRRVTPPTLAKMKRDGMKITVLTAYDAAIARLVEAAGIDAIIVGDSLGNVVQGRDSTIGVRLADMIYHTEIVARCTRRPMVIADLPFMTYQQDVATAMESARRCVQEAGAGAVKLEGGVHIAPQIRALVNAGIPVMGHVGLTPQSSLVTGQGKIARDRTAILADAKAAQDAGCFSIVLEGMPPEIARDVTAALTIPTIGIGAGVDCDGQVLVTYDMLGLHAQANAHVPKFVKAYANIEATIRDALAAYAADVRGKTFPGLEHTYGA